MKIPPELLDDSTIEELLSRLDEIEGFKPGDIVTHIDDPAFMGELEVQRVEFVGGYEVVYFVGGGAWVASRLVKAAPEVQR